MCSICYAHRGLPWSLNGLDIQLVPLYSDVPAFVWIEIKSVVPTNQISPKIFDLARMEIHRVILRPRGHDQPSYGS